MTQGEDDEAQLPLELPFERPKVLKRPLPVVGDDVPELVPARMVNELLYCERLFYLEWVQGEFEDNLFTVDGKHVHTRVDRPGRARGRIKRGSPATPEAPPEKPYQARSVWLSSERLGVTAKIDIVEERGDGTAIPIDYKRGKQPDVPEGAYLPERAQVCVQVLLLRENGYRVPEGNLYFAADRKRVTVVIDDALIATTLAAVRRARELAAADRLPPPLRNSPKCNGCSLVGIWLPDEVHLLQDEPPAADVPEGTSVDVEPEPRIRPLATAIDERLPLYVSDQGAWVKLDGERLVVRTRDGVETDVRLPNTSQVCLYGSVQISTQAVRSLLERGVPIVFFTYGGWYLGRTVANDSKNVELRIAQHRAAADPERCLRLARGFVAAKILNSRTMLRRNTPTPDEVVLFELKQLARKATEATAIETLLGLEGTAARSYFQSFSGMLGEDALRHFDLDGRNRRPPRDPVNALLSFAYSLLTKDITLAVAAVGLDPMLGFYHRPRFGRPALALDLMEELRPLVADSVVIGVLNGRIVGEDDFVEAGGAFALSAAARRRVVLAYERRMQQVVTHPVFGYRVPYRRVLELQARLLTRVLLGEVQDYPSFRTR